MISGKKLRLIIIDFNEMKIVGHFLYKFKCFVITTRRVFNSMMMNNTTNTNRSRWSTSMSIGVKLPAATGAQVPPLIAQRKKTTRPNTSQPQSFSQRMAKTKHEIEELFKLYYSNSIKFDSFERQIVTGTRIPSARISSSSLVDPHLTESSTNVFNSKHCVSREMIDEIDEIKEPIVRRSVQVRLDYAGVTPSPRTPRQRQDETTEISLDKSFTSLDELPVDAFEQFQLKRSKTITNCRPSSSKSSSMGYPPVPPPSLLLMSPLKESQSSFSNSTSVDPSNCLTPIVTGKAVIVQSRSPSPSRLQRQKARAKSTLAPRKITTKSLELPETTNYLSVQRVVSIPSKCSRYVLVSLPQTRMRYKTPSYMERLLLPERFPTLFQNIVQSYDQTSNR